MASTVRINKQKLESLIRTTPGKADALLRAAAEEIVGDIVESFGPSPSAPGEPPGVDTGALRASIGWQKEREGRYIVHDGVEYGVYLESGTESIAPRPFMTPVLEEWRARKFGELARDMGLFE